MTKYARAARACATYFQFPLCAFAFGTTERERLEAIISYGLVEAGSKRWAKLTYEQRQAVIHSKGNSLPRDFQERRESHCNAVCGAQVTNVTIGGIQACCNRHTELWAFCKFFCKRNGHDAMVRLKTDLVFEARDGKGITPRELSVLAAIYPIIGRKQGPVLITQDQIRRRALGYKKKTVMTVELPRRKDGAQPLSDWQLRTLLDRLQARRFFARVTYGRRLSYYSHRMRDQKLREAVFNMKTFRFANKHVRRYDDAAMTDAIRNQCA